MNHEQQALWQRIRDFRFDAPGASFPFSKRLAREQGWTPAYTARVVEEYRRFAFLAVAAGHGVTPSKAVDEAWHLHLLYTRNYWDAFCGEALGRPLHHNPADGNEADDQKYAGWYEATLASYERFFGEPPPEDVWPRGAISERKRRLWPWALFLPAVLAGCAEPTNPLDWRGPEFLGLFALVAAVALGGALAVRYLLRRPFNGPPAAEWGLHPYEQAFLNEGPRLALATALARLAASGALEVDAKSGKMRAVEGVTGDHPLDRAVLRAVGPSGDARYGVVQSAAKPALDEMEGSLRRQGLWMSPGAASGTAFASAAAMAVPLLLGGAKILVGVDRHRPVGFLVVGCVLTVLAGFCLLVPPKRSRYGNRVLAELRALRGYGRPVVASGMDGGMDLASGVALFGMVALAGTPYAHLRAAFVPPPTVSGGDGGSSCGTSSCGSSSCGGGGGCGGGGCGGCGS